MTYIEPPGTAYLSFDLPIRQLETLGYILIEALSWLIEILTHQAVGNSFLLLASIIGVVGSYRLYQTREQNKRDKLRRALAFEIKEMDKLGETAESLQGITNPPPADRLSASKVPPADAFPTSVYESNTSQLGLLSEEELEDIVHFYTSVMQHKGVIGALRENPEDVPMPDHEELLDSIPDLAQERNDLLSTLGFSDLIEQ